MNSVIKSRHEAFNQQGRLTHEGNRYSHSSVDWDAHMNEVDWDGIMNEVNDGTGSEADDDAASSEVLEDANASKVDQGTGLNDADEGASMKDCDSSMDEVNDSTTSEADDDASSSEVLEDASASEVDQGSGMSDADEDASMNGVEDINTSDVERQSADEHDLDSENSSMYTHRSFGDRRLVSLRSHILYCDTQYHPEQATIYEEFINSNPVRSLCCCAIILSDGHLLNREPSPPDATLQSCYR